MIRASYYFDTRAGESYITEWDDCMPEDKLNEEIPVGYTEEMDNSAFDTYFGD